MIISPDNLLLDENGKYVWSVDRVKKAWDYALDEWKKAAEKEDVESFIIMCGMPGAGKSTYLSKNYSEKSVYFDATSVAPKRRKHLLQLIKKSKAKKICVYLNTPFNVCIERNNTRTDDRKVPMDVMKRMNDNLKTPDKSEGFDQIITIK